MYLYGHGHAMNLVVSSSPCWSYFLARRILRRIDDRQTLLCVVMHWQEDWVSSTEGEGAMHTHARPRQARTMQQVVIVANRPNCPYSAGGEKKNKEKKETCTRVARVAYRRRRLTAPPASPPPSPIYIAARCVARSSSSSPMDDDASRLPPLANTFPTKVETHASTAGTPPTNHTLTKWPQSDDSRPQSADSGPHSDDSGPQADNSSPPVGHSAAQPSSCCGPKSLLTNWRYGAFYWRRGRVMGLMSLTILLSCIGEFIAILSASLASRQVERTTQAYIRLLNLADDILYLGNLYFDELEDLTSYDVETNCALQELFDAIDDVRENCSTTTVVQLHSRLGYLWNTTEAAIGRVSAGELNCTVPAKWDRSGASGFGGMFAACRIGCDLESDVAYARELYFNLTTSAWLGYVGDASAAVSTFADAIVESEGAMNSLSSTVGFTDETCTAERGPSRYSTSDALGGINDRLDLDDDAATSIGCDDDLFYLDYADNAQTVAEKFDEVSSCMNAFSAGDQALDLPSGAELSSQFPDCDRDEELEVLRQAIRYIQLMVKWLRFGIDVCIIVCKLVRRGVDSVVYYTFALFFVSHLVTLLFLEYTVFFPSYSYKKYWLQLANCGHYKNRLLGREQDDYERPSNDFSPRDRPGSPSTKATSKLTAAQSAKDASCCLASCLCDVDYHARFWILYVLHDALFWLALFFAPCCVLMVVAGDKRNCSYMYNTLIQRFASVYKRLLRTARNSCLKDLVEEVSDLTYAETWDDRICAVRDSSSYVTTDEYASQSITLTVAAFMLLIIQWHFVRWFPVAMSFAQPRSLRKQLDKLQPVEASQQVEEETSPPASPKSTTDRELSDSHPDSASGGQLGCTTSQFDVAHSPVTPKRQARQPRWLWWRSDQSSHVDSDQGPRLSRKDDIAHSRDQDPATQTVLATPFVQTAQPTGQDSDAAAVDV